MEFRNGYKIERFNTNFNTNGWASLYIGAMVINLLATFMNIPFNYLLVGSSMYGVVSVSLFTIKTFAMFFTILSIIALYPHGMYIPIVIILSNMFAKITKKREL